MVDNEVLINEQGELNRELTLHMARMDECKDMDEVKKEMINHMKNELKIREKYTNHRIQLINESEMER